MIFSKPIAKKYKSLTFVRCDEDGFAYYFSAKDFPGLVQESFSFTTRFGNKLQGYFYHYGNPKPGKLIIFDHGMGRGHRSYMREIETVAKAGYLVFAYDHTGNMESEGRDINGLGGSVADLDSCIKALKADDRYKNLELNIIGHSWGGYATLNIPALHPDIEKIVAISGFVSVKRMVDQNFGGPLALFRNTIYDIEQKANPETYQLDAAKNLQSFEGKALIIHSEDDDTVKFKPHFEALECELKHKPNFVFWKMNGKIHNPNYTVDAVTYKNEFFKVLTAKQKKGELKTADEQKAFKDSYDWWRMTAQDENFWNRIFEFIG